MLLLEDCNLDNLNSVTKYPSIPTYHARGDRGRLTESVQVRFDDDESVCISEKIDGTNARIVLFPHLDYIIGSREEWLFARGDRVRSKLLGIVAALTPLLDTIHRSTAFSSDILVLYLEAYGHGVGKSAQEYSGLSRSGYRLFDVAAFPEQDLRALLALERMHISGWRKKGGQPFSAPTAMAKVAEQLSIGLVPPLCPLQIPTSLPDTLQWMRQLAPRSAAALDDRAGERPEGVVVRTPDRKKIAKFRFDDYNKVVKG